MKFSVTLVGRDPTDAVLCVEGRVPHTSQAWFLGDLEESPLKEGFRVVVMQMMNMPATSLTAEVIPKEGAKEIADAADILSAEAKGEFAIHDENAVPALRNLAPWILHKFGEQYEFGDGGAARKCFWCGCTSIGALRVGSEERVFPLCPSHCVSHKFGQSVETVGDCEAGC